MSSFIFSLKPCSSWFLFSKLTKSHIGLCWKETYKNEKHILSYQILNLITYLYILRKQNAIEILSHICNIKPWLFLLFDRRRFLRYMYIPTTAHTTAASPTVSIITIMFWLPGLSDPGMSLWILYCFVYFFIWVFSNSFIKMTNQNEMKFIFNISQWSLFTYSFTSCNAKSNSN